MQKLGITRFLLVGICALPLIAGAQQGLQLKSQPTLILIPPALKEEVPVFIDAERLQGRQDGDIEAEGTVRLRKRGQAVQADWLRYDQPAEELNAEGNVRMEAGADAIEGPRLRFNVRTERGEMESPRYTLHKVQPPVGQRQIFREEDARGTAERLLFEGPGQYRAENTEYTTCGPGNDSWYVRARDITLYRDRDVGVAHNATIEFMGAPIFYSPYLSFSLHQQRKSGFLTPHYSSSSTTGSEVTIPYYFNIAPNRDATIAPRIMTKRGMLIEGEFRYLEPTYLGESKGEILPNDDERGGDQRWAYLIKHNHNLPSGWSGALKMQRVSDDNYFTDLSTKIAETSQVQLPSDLVISRVSAWGNTGSYSVNALAQRWQTLQVDPLAPVTPPYNRLPQLALTAVRPELLFTEFDFYGQYAAFDHPTLVSGQRAIAYPSLNLPLQTSYAYLVPKIGVNATRYYSIGQNTSGYADQSRTLPIFSTDSGLIFERPTAIGGTPLVQTLEPRVYYVYIPFRDQASIPVFDSAQQDVNFATIYSENQFSGWDRINDANQVTVGVSSRLIDSNTGAQVVRAGLAQRYYFSSQRVTLPGVPARASDTSDLLAALSGTVAPNWTADAGVQYNTDTSQTQKFNVGTRYLPRPGHVLNLSYRSTTGVLRQTDFSTQWPLSHGWTGLARWNYSLRDNRSLESLIGTEYNGGCWMFRLIGHRFVTTTQQVQTQIFVQLELNGVSRIGSNPMEALKRNISGYLRYDQQPPNPENAGPLHY